MGKSLLATLGLPPPRQPPSAKADAPGPAAAAPLDEEEGSPAAPGAEAAAPEANGELPADLAAACEKHLSAHRFKATRSPEVVPGDARCDVWLDDHLVKQEDVRAALLAALPALAPYPIPLARLVAERWDLELRQALVMSGSGPRDTPMTVAKPDGVLARSVDGQQFWQPAPLATMAGSEPVVDDGWLKDFFEFYDVAPGPAGGKPGACRFNDADDTLDGAVRKAGEQAALAGYKPNASAAAGIAKAILDRRDAARRQGAAVAEQVKAARSAKPGASKEPNQGLQVAASLGAQYSGHWELKPLPTKKAEPPADAVYQLQFALNNVRHPEGRKGEEFQGQLVLGYNSITRKWQVLGGTQFVAVVAVWRKVQVQYFGNLQAGISFSEKSPIRGVFQVATGVQATLTIGDAQISVALGGGVTITESAPTLDAGPAFGVGVSVPFDRPPEKKKAEPDEPAIDLGALEKLPMAGLLDALEAIRDAKQLDKMGPVVERIRIARLAVLGQTDHAIAAMAPLPEADRDALRKYLVRGIGRS